MTRNTEKKQVIATISFKDPIFLSEETRIEIRLLHEGKPVSLSLVTLALQNHALEAQPRLLTDINFYGHILTENWPDEAMKL